MDKQIRRRMSRILRETVRLGVLKEASERLGFGEEKGNVLNGLF